MTLTEQIIAALEKAVSAQNIELIDVLSKC